MKLLHISDTHCRHKAYNKIVIPDDIDLIVHSGDATQSRGAKVNMEEMKQFVKWYSSFTDIPKVFVPGNHDTCLDPNKNPDYLSAMSLFENTDIQLLMFDESIEDNVHNVVTNSYLVRILPMQYTKAFYDWAFNKTDEELTALYNTVSLSSVDIIVSHEPPLGFNDFVIIDNNIGEDAPSGRVVRGFCNVGNTTLREIVDTSTSLKAVLCGHIHNQRLDYNTVLANAVVTTYRNIQISNAASLIDGSFNTGFYTLEYPNIITI
jgi:3',5'-cyclic AMP phosphodiesterase CpdA